MNREEFKLNLIRQFKHDRYNALPLLIPRESSNRVKGSIYTDCKRYYSDKYNLFVTLNCSPLENDFGVEIDFADMTDEELGFARDAFDDLTSEVLTARTYYQEYLHFENQELYFNLEVFRLVVEDGKFKKKISQIEMNFVFSFIDKKVKLGASIDAIIENLESLRGKRATNVYVDGIYTKPLIEAFLTEVSDENIGSNERNYILKLLREEYAITRRRSAACELLGALRMLYM